MLSTGGSSRERSGTVQTYRGRRNWAEKHQESGIPKRQCPRFCLKYKKNDLWDTVFYKNFQ